MTLPLLCLKLVSTLFEPLNILQNKRDRCLHIPAIFLRIQ